MLKGVIKNYQVRLREVLVLASATLAGCVYGVWMTEEAAAFISGFVHGYSDIRKLAFDLHRQIHKRSNKKLSHVGFKGMEHNFKRHELY